MARYLLKRTLSGLIALLIYLAVLFFLIQIIIPYDFVTQFAIGMSPEEREALREELGLHLPLWQQFLTWMGGIFTGDLGASLEYPYPPVMGIIKVLLPPTLLLFVTGTVIAFLLGLWLGTVTGWRDGGWLSGVTSFGAITFYTSFPPWLAFLIIYIFAFQFGWFPPLASRDILYNNRELWQTTTWEPEGVMFYQVLSLVVIPLVFSLGNLLLKRWWRRLPFWVLIPLALASWVGSWYVLGFGREAVDILRFATLPILIYTLLSFGETLLIMQTSMRDVRNEDYVKTARAKGLSEANIRYRHAARNALFPVLSRLFISFPYLLTGLVIIELSVRWPGTGSVLFGSVDTQNMPVVMGILLLVGVISLGARLILDVLYGLLNPRIRYGTQGVREG